MTIFKTNPRLVKDSYYLKIILIYNIWTLLSKKMSKTWSLLVFVSLKYCVEKRFLKTPLRFFMKVTVYLLQQTHTKRGKL
jgi:hypothetical protein